MKYTIELTDNQKGQMDLLIEMAHKHVGFNPKLEPIQDSLDSELDKQIQEAYDSGYNNGVEDLSHAMRVYSPLNSTEKLNYFGLNVHVDNYATVSPKNLIDKAKAYEKMKETTIECGDEVTILKSGIRGIVFAIRGDVYEVLSGDAKWYKLQEHQIEKTGCNLKADVTRLLDKLTSKDK